MSRRFAGQTALITGAAGNLGQAVARAFERDGARLALLDVDAARLRATYPPGDGCLALAVDLFDRDAVARAADAVRARFGRIDILCNIAGGFRMGPAVHETPADLWRLMIDLNATSIIHAAGAVVPGMLAQGGGKIVNIASVAGLHANAAMGAYGAAKAAVIRLTESMAGELRDKGINVNCVMPSVIDTPENRRDMPGADPAKWVAPEALADVILFLASNEARALNGAAVPVVGLS